VVLPLTVIRRLDCVLEPTKRDVLAVYDQFGDRAPLLLAAAKAQFWNSSPLTLAKVLEVPAVQPRP
jgi:type I restriction enzyme M protein